MRFLLAAALIILPLAAWASEPRPIDMTVVLMDAMGKPIVDSSKVTAEDPKCEKCGPLTLGAAVAAALLVDRRDEPNISALEKAKRGLLALKIMDDKGAVLTAGQIADITKLMAIWPPIVVARALPLLDPNIDLSK